MKARLPAVCLPEQLSSPILLGIHTLEQSADARIVVLDRTTIIRLTPIEARIFSSLLAKPRTLVVGRDLAVALQAKNQEVQTQNLVRHISSLRFKFRHSGLFIRRVIGCGWLLTDEHEEKDTLE